MPLRSSKYASRIADGGPDCLEGLLEDTPCGLGVHMSNHSSSAHLVGIMFVRRLRLFWERFVLGFLRRVGQVRVLYATKSLLET